MTAGQRLVGEVRHVVHDFDRSVFGTHFRRYDAAGEKEKVWWVGSDGEPTLGGKHPADVLYGGEQLQDRAGEAVILVEGEPPKDALESLGFLANGTVCGAGTVRAPRSISARAAQHYRDRCVFLWPDADLDGLGAAHMRANAASLAAAGVDELWVVAWLGAPDHGDAGDYVASGGNADGVRALLKAAVRLTPESAALSDGSRRDDGAPDDSDRDWVLLPGPTDPMRVARAVLGELWHGDPPGLIRWRDTFLAWRGSYWDEVQDPAVRADLYQLLERACYWTKDEEGKLLKAPWRPTRARVANVFEALQAVAALDDHVEDRSWVRYDGRWAKATRGNALPSNATTSGDHDVLPVSDGILDLRTRTLLAPEPGFFNLSALPFEISALLHARAKTISGNAWPRVAVPAWMGFLNSLWPDDREKITLLQEWFGYVLSGDIRQHKCLLLVGPPRSGKGTIGRVLGALVGRPRHTASPTMSGLAQNFGLASLIGKTLAVVADARFTGRDLMVAIERLLTISGADYIDVPRKFKTDWHGQLGIRFTFLSNELPRLPDVSGAIATRFLVLELAQSWLGKEDLNLEDRLMPELPGIMLWGLAGLDRLRERGRFSEPASSLDATRTLMNLTSATKAFLGDRCVVGPHFEIETGVAFQAWQEWCKVNGLEHSGDRQKFGKDLRAAVPGLKTPQRGDSRAAPTRVYVGFRLRVAGEPEAGSGSKDSDSTPAAAWQDGSPESPPDSAFESGPDVPP